MDKHCWALLPVCDNAPTPPHCCKRKSCLSRLFCCPLPRVPLLVPSPPNTRTTGSTGHDVSSTWEVPFADSAAFDKDLESSSRLGDVLQYLSCVHDASLCSWHYPLDLLHHERWAVHAFFIALSHHLQLRAWHITGAQLILNNFFGLSEILHWAMFGIRDALNP